MIFKLLLVNALTPKFFNKSTLLALGKKGSHE